MSNAAPQLPSPAWPAAVRLVARWLDHRERIDTLLDALPPKMAGAERARCQYLAYGVIRHFGRLDAAIAKLVAHPPRSVTRAVLLVAGFELLEAVEPSRAMPASEGTAAVPSTAAAAESGPPESEASPSGTDEKPPDSFAGRAPKIVHHAVEQAKTIASPAEARLVNAVVRKLAAALSIQPPPPPDASAEALAEFFSHPDWLVRSWLAQFGAEATRALLEWNQQPAPVYARWRVVEQPSPPFLKSTKWDGFYEVESGHWGEIEPLLKSGSLYLQDPSTRLPVNLLAPRKNETVIDLCAAPGGKALLIADTMESGRLVAVDLPTSRIDRLKENLSRAGAVDVALVQADILKDFANTLREHKLPLTYDGVVVDVPCSNTGVMRHRVDVKWRLQAGDFKKHPQQQLAMLHQAARLVAPGGRLVYSTCSIDTEENEHVVREFLASRAAGPFKLESSIQSFPWKDGHDGAAAFLLRRTAAG